MTAFTIFALLFGAVMSGLLAINAGAIDGENIGAGRRRHAIDRSRSLALACIVLILAFVAGAQP